MDRLNYSQAYSYINTLEGSMDRLDDSQAYTYTLEGPMDRLKYSQAYTCTLEGSMVRPYILGHNL